MEDQEPRDADDSDELEAAIMQADHAFGAESVGTTAEEGLEGESLDARLAEERPERPGIDEGSLGGRRRRVRRRGRSCRRRGARAGRVRFARGGGGAAAKTRRAPRTTTSVPHPADED